MDRRAQVVFSLNEAEVALMHEEARFKVFAACGVLSDALIFPCNAVSSALRREGINRLIAEGREEDGICKFHRRLPFLVPHDPQVNNSNAQLSRFSL